MGDGVGRCRGETDGLAWIHFSANVRNTEENDSGSPARTLTGVVGDELEEGTLLGPTTRGGAEISIQTSGISVRLHCSTKVRYVPVPYCCCGGDVPPSAAVVKAR